MTNIDFNKEIKDKTQDLRGKPKSKKPQARDNIK